MKHKTNESGIAISGIPSLIAGWTSEVSHLVSARSGALLLILVGMMNPALSQVPAPESTLEMYRALNRFQLNGGKASVENLTLRRDRLEMTFNGVFHFEQSIAGRVRGAVFLGRGTFKAEVPPVNFERQHVRRMLDADVVESDFRTAVLRFSDDTFEYLGVSLAPQNATPPKAQELADEFGPRMLKETGANMHSRLLVSILNTESPGIFVAVFDKGKRKRFTALLDYQGRIPASTFGLNGFEKGLIFQHGGGIGGNDIWTAFHAQQNYQDGKAKYSDSFDLVSTEHYRLNVDLTRPKKFIKVNARLDFKSKRDGLRAIPLDLSESLPEYRSARLKKAMRLKSARHHDGAPINAIQEDWEGGLTVVLPQPVSNGEDFSIELEVEGDFMFDSPLVANCFYPLSNAEWYPRHGTLNRSTFDLEFLHDKRHRVMASGILVKEEPVAESESLMITGWQVQRPVALVTFGVGPFEKHEDTIKTEGGELPIEFYSLPGSVLVLKEDFIMAEMMNSLRYFTALFGEYPYSKFGGLYHPRGFGQGFASLLLLPKSDRSSKYTYSFIAHETAHQWWGNIVAWRSYHDQWLSEGFAEYSGILYTSLRDKPKAARDLVRRLRRSLKERPETQTGVGEGRLTDVGPIIMGHRLSTRETAGAYTTLIYNKGALVLRMLHFLFTNPSSGDGQPFFDMMSDFVTRHRDGSASTDDFRRVANEHFARTPIAQKHGIQDLNWFFRQWVYQTYLPTYRMEYRVEKGDAGATVLRGTVYQEDVPENWFMPLPLVLEFGKDQIARGTVHALGPSTPFEIKLPANPKKVQLDPDHWVLSEKTSTRRRN